MTDAEQLKNFRKAGDIRYSVCASPLGELLLVAGDTLLKAVIFGTSARMAGIIERDFREGSTPPIECARALLDAYFRLLSSCNKPADSGRRLRFSLKRTVLRLNDDTTSVDLDLAPYTAKEISVYRALMGIAFGRTVSYGALAGLAGIHGGARFIGNTMAKNNFPILIPCHRVIRSDGSIGNYSSGTNIKKFLLEHECGRGRA